MWISEAACPAETSQLILSSLCFASSELQLSYLPLKKKKKLLLQRNGQIGICQNLPFLLLQKVLLKEVNRDYPGSPGDETLHSQCSGPGFDPWSGN